MQFFKQRGGAQIGWMSASWPLAGIEVSQGKLIVSSLGRYAFEPSDVTAVEEVGAIPILSQGIRIHHSNTRYPEKIVFYSLSGRTALLAAVRRAGFTIGQPITQTKRGFPMRLSAVIGLVVVWNAIFLLKGTNLEKSSHSPGPLEFFALAALFALATLLPKSKTLQAVFMRSGRDVGEVASLLRLVQLVTCFVMFGFGISYLRSDA
jgi:hypothetical protein